MLLRRKPLVAIAGLLTVALLSVGYALASTANDRSRDAEAVQFSPVTEPVVPFAGEPIVEARRLSERYPAVRNLVIRPAAEDPDALEVDFDVGVRSFGPAHSLYAIWQGQLLTGLLREKYAASNAGRIISVGMTLVDERGQRDRLGGGFGAAVPGQKFVAVNEPGREAIEARVRELGFSNVDVRLVPALQDAVSITARHENAVEAVTKMIRARGVLSAVLPRDPHAFEGVYIEVRDASDEAVYIAATALRAGAGVTWARPGSCIEDGRSGSAFTPYCKRRLLAHE